uniref:Uncharacterized protein n=1 Tax=Anguilla anguilla TaxID=7936 RepID=A0A0E9RND3_ANGAN
MFILGAHPSICSTAERPSHAQATKAQRRFFKS